MKINWVYHDNYDIPLKENHRFTSTKFSDLFAVLKNSKLYENAIINNPSAAALSDLTISHCLTYINKIQYGLLSYKEERKLGLSWSKRLSERSFLAVNGTLLTANLAIKNGIGCHLGGGTHHSHFDYGAGFCVFNDLAYAALMLINNKIVKKILIFDCDVHQGDGTARILEKNDNIFTCSIHCKKNFPLNKAQSNLDIELEDHTNNTEYLNEIQKTIKFCVNSFKPDFVLYDAGIDIHKDDELGKINIDDDGCLERDILVLNFLKKLSIPVATVIGGGYSKNKDELALRHSFVFNAANQVFG